MVYFFRKVVALVVKRRAASASLDLARYAGDSLRLAFFHVWSRQPAPKKHDRLVIGFLTLED